MPHGRTDADGLAAAAAMFASLFGPLPLPTKPSWISLALSFTIRIRRPRRTIANTDGGSRSVHRVVRGVAQNRSGKFDGFLVIAMLLYVSRLMFGNAFGRSVAERRRKVTRP